MGKIGRRLFQHLVTLAVGMGRVDKKFRLVNVTSVDVKKIINDGRTMIWQKVGRMEASIYGCSISFRFEVLCNP